MMILNTRPKKVLDQAAERALSELDGERFYRLLGAYRGMPEAVIDYARTADGIEWIRWQDSRF